MLIGQLGFELLFFSDPATKRSALKLFAKR